MSAIHIFDMDDTLLVTPTFADVMNQGSDPRLEDFLVHVKQAFMLFMSKEIDLVTKGDFIVLVDAVKGTNIPPYYLTTVREKLEETEATMKPEAFKKLFGIKRSAIKEVLAVLGEKDGHVVVLQIRGFHGNPATIGSVLNKEVEQPYRQAANKMIVTGRGVELMPHITSRLGELDLEYPNYGLHCYPQNKYKSIQEFKIASIRETIQINGWTEVHFYEDRRDWLDAGERSTKETYPHVEFVKHHITSVHDSRTL